MHLWDYKHILRLTRGTQKGKEGSQNAIRGTMPGIIWKVR